MNINCYDKYGNTIYAFYQWDKNQTIYIDDLNITTAPFFHFQNKNTTYPIEVKASLSNGTVSVKVPNELLEEAFTIDGYIYVDEKSIGRICIPVYGRQKPSDTEYVDTFNMVSISVVNSEIDTLTAEVNTLLNELTAENLIYDNSEVDLSATNVQAAIDEIANSHVFIED